MYLKVLSQINILIKQPFVHYQLIPITHPRIAHVVRHGFDKKYPKPTYRPIIDAQH